MTDPCANAKVSVIDPGDLLYKLGSGSKTITLDADVKGNKICENAYKFTIVLNPPPQLVFKTYNVIDQKVLFDFLPYSG